MLRPRNLRRPGSKSFFAIEFGSQLMRCTACGLLTNGEEDLCTFCRCRNKFWVVLDDIPVPLRGWAINSLRVWTSVIAEESDKFHEAQKKREALESTAISKAKSPAPSGTPEAGSENTEKAEEEPKPDKAWVSTKREEEASRSSPVGEVRVREEAEEGRYSSSSRPIKKDSRQRSRRRSHTRSRSRNQRKRKSKTRSRSRQRRRRDSRDKKERESRPSKPVEVERTEQRARPSVRPPKTPSRSPPGRHQPPKKVPPIIRPAVKKWDGRVPSWKLHPRWYGENKGAKKRERHYYRAQEDVQ